MKSVNLATRKQARQNTALNNFRILSFNDFRARFVHVPKDVVDQYTAYRERKLVERAALERATMKPAQDLLSKKLLAHASEARRARRRGVLTR